MVITSRTVANTELLTCLMCPFYVVNHRQYRANYGCIIAIHEQTETHVRTLIESTTSPHFYTPTHANYCS